MSEVACCCKQRTTSNQPTCKEVRVAAFIPIRNRPPRKDLTGERFGRLVVRAWAGSSHWICRCDCGSETRVLTANLTRNNTRSCGCIRNHLSSLRNTKHGLHGTPAYKTWASVKRRCYEKQNASYKDYGAKGIRMHAGWINDPEAFIKYIGQPPSDDHTLDRIDNAKGYEPGNIRWATPLEQASNKTNNRWVIYQGVRYTISQLARKIAQECGISHSQMLSALEHEMYGRKRRRAK